MQLGTGLFTAQQRPDDDREMSALYDEVLAVTRAIEDAGLDSAWVSEHHFAEDAATVDLLSDDRLTLGLAIGSNPREFDVFGVPREERAERLADLVEFLGGAWSEGELGYDSEFHDVPTDVSITPRPAGEHVPVMLGGAAKPAVRRAARTADAWCAPSSLSIGAIKKRVEDIRTVRENEGIEGDFTVYVIQHGWVGDSREEAWETMKGGYLYIQRRYAEIFSGEPVDELDPERRQELKDQAIFGTPEQVTERLETYEKALGDDVHFIFRTYHPGVGTDAMTDCIHRLGEEVAPEL